LLNPDPSRRLTAEQALTHSWVTSFAAPTEHDLSGLRENFDPRARWRNAISAARVLSRFGNHKGANNHKDKSVVSSDDEDDDGGGGSTSWRATPKTDNNRPQQQLSPSSPSLPDDRVPRRGLAGLVAAGATRPVKTTPPPLPLPPSPMSFSDAIKKAKVAAAATAEADKVRDEGGQQAQATTSQPIKTQHVVPRRDNEKGGEAHVASERRAEGDEDEEEDEEVELRIPGSFDFENHDSGAARARAGAVDSFDAVGMLGNLWRRMQVR
jgi:calcium/calmodulin-dependent protein kinase I